MLELTVESVLKLAERNVNKDKTLERLKIQNDKTEVLTIFEKSASFSNKLLEKLTFID